MPTYIRKRNRLKGYDYDQAGYYFVTICTKERHHYFGQIKNGQILNSPYGEIAYRFWREIPVHYANVEIDEFIIMPNHIHGIIIIHPTVATGHSPTVETGQCPVATAGHRSAPTADTLPLYGLLSKIVRGFKEAVTKTIRNQFQDKKFGWQRSFYDHIIRNDLALQNIRGYIRENPLKWELDRDNPENLYM